MKHKIYSFFLISIVLVLIFPANATSWVGSRPSKDLKYKKYEFSAYNWIYNHQKATLYIEATEAAQKFISISSIERYVKLKFRNFINVYDIKKKHEGYDYNYITLTIELIKYNDKLNIYFGLIDFKVSPSITDKGKPKIYRLTRSIAGSEDQILSFIKQTIDSMVEIFAEDFYLMQDYSKEKIR